MGNKNSKFRSKSHLNSNLKNNIVIDEVIEEAKEYCSDVKMPKTKASADLELKGEEDLKFEPKKKGSRHRDRDSIRIPEMDVETFDDDDEEEE